MTRYICGEIFKVSAADLAVLIIYIAVFFLF